MLQSLEFIKFIIINILEFNFLNRSLIQSSFEYIKNNEAFHKIYLLYDLK